jgi:hypothetical protein
LAETGLLETGAPFCVFFRNGHVEVRIEAAGFLKTPVQRRCVEDFKNMGSRCGSQNAVYGWHDLAVSHKSGYIDTLFFRFSTAVSLALTTSSFF